MRPAPPAAAARLRSRVGVAPAFLLDVETPSGDRYYWSDRKLANMPAVIGAPALVTYLPWLLAVGSFSFNRSLQTDTGSLTLQNLSGDVLATDFERIAQRSTLEGSQCVFRWYAVDLGYAIRECHGELSVDDAGTTVKLNMRQQMAGQDDTPEQTVCETCQLNWAEARCGSTEDFECNYTYASCQVPEHFVGIQTAFETNNPAAAANLPTLVINRKRAW